MIWRMCNKLQELILRGVITNLKARDTKASNAIEYGVKIIEDQ